MAAGEMHKPLTAAAGEVGCAPGGGGRCQPRLQWRLLLRLATALVSYTRGLDLSGSLQGAGGIGGLLARTQHTGTDAGTGYYHRDGNGNVTSILAPDGQSLLAAYLFDPYGRTLEASGVWASANVYRFSSKEHHAASGLYYYGFRFYSPNLQRWINRDPIEEAGGINLYGFVGNDAMNGVDPYGFWSFYKWLYTGDGNLDDEVFDEAMDGAAESVQATAPIAHKALDTLSYIDPTRLTVAVDAGLYAAMGENDEALSCAAGLIPGGKQGKKVASVSRAVQKGEQKVIGNLENAGLQKIENNFAANRKSPNPFGSPGKPDHQTTVDVLKGKAKSDFPDDVIHAGTSINNKTGVNRRPDVWVEDAKTGKVKQVYEAARQNKDGSFVARECRKAVEYDKAKLPAHFEPVK